MKQVIRRGLKEIIVDEVADPVVTSNSVLVRPFYSLISSGTETADIHTDNIIKEVADNPGHLQTVWNVMMKTDPVSTFNEGPCEVQGLRGAWLFRCRNRHR